MKHWFDDALLINRDPNWYGWVAEDLSDREAAERSARTFFEQFTHDRITDMQLCVFENTSVIPSEAVMWRGLKYLQTEEDGHPVSYPKLGGLYRMYAELKTDPVLVFIDVMRKAGIRPWITLRVNDAHFGGDETAFLRDDFFYEARDRGWMIGGEYGYFAHCLDWNAEPVRTRILGLIREILGRYDLFGLELDFMREPYCFDYRHCTDRHDVMNRFMASVSRMALEAGNRLGHPVRLMVRMPAEIADAYAFGFDAGFWAKNRWIDAVVPTPRWEVTDSGIPVAEWKALVGEDVAVFPGLECLHLDFTRLTREEAKAYSAAWNAQGADGLYFNNHDYATPRHRAMYDLRRDTVTEGARRFVVTYQDIAAEPDTRRKPLPMKLDGEGTLSLRIGPVTERDHAALILGFEGEPPAVRWNGNPLPPPDRIPPVTGEDESTGEPKALTGEGTWACSCEGMRADGPLTLTFDGRGILRYVELRMEN